MDSKLTKEDFEIIYDLKLNPNQVKFLSNYNKREVINVVNARQVGMSTIIAVTCLYECLLPSNGICNVIVCPNKEMLNHMREKIIGLFNKCKLNNGIFVKITHDNREEITFNNARHIMFLTANSNPQTRFRGYNVNSLFLCDFDFFLNKDSWWDAITNYCVIPKKLVIQSTPNNTNGIFHNICKYNIRNTIKLTNGEDENKKKILSEKKYKSDVLAEFYEGEEKEQLINVRVTESQKNKIKENAEQKGIKNVSEYIRMEALKETTNESTHEFKVLDNTVKTYLFALKDKDKNISNLTPFIRSIDIKEDKIYIVYFEDESQQFKKFLEDNIIFYVSSLSRTGEVISDYKINSRILKQFPNKFNHDSDDILTSTVIFENLY